jgi:thiamine pyrophosphokinase
MVFIIAGGLIRNLEFLRSRISEMSPKAVICADGGARHAHAIGLIPQIITGDMDSLPSGLLRKFADLGAIIQRYPAGKDETDTILAFEAAVTFQPSEIWVFGALGYRLDHTLANLSLLLKGEERQIPVKLVDEWCEVFLVTDTCTFTGKVGQTVSLLPFFGMVTGVTLTGFEYSLEKGTLSMEAPLGISNRLTSESGTISIDSGYLLVIRYFQEGVFPS